MRTDRRRTCLPFARLISILALATLAMAVLSACSQSTAPTSQDQTTAQATFEGALDPGASSFVLRSVPASQPGQAPVAVKLIGSNLVVDSTAETVSLDVAIRNASTVTLFAPALVRLSALQPSSVTALELDLDYSALLGSDGALSPGELSASKTWHFSVPGLTSFSFAAMATFGVQPGAPVIAGAIFRDENSNGVRDAGDGPFYGTVNVVRPDGITLTATAVDSGTYSFPVQDVGLYTLTYQPPLLRCRCEVVVTTTNPLQVVLTPDENGAPRSFLHADFGAHVGPLGEFPQPVVLTDLPPEQIHQDSYHLLAIELTGDVMTLRVGFTGCGPDHGFTLYMVGGFMESNPVQAKLLLAHDRHGEDCPAEFERTLLFDLTPLREAFEHAYGQTGPVRLRFSDFQGAEHEFLYTWGPPNTGNLLSNGTFERNGQPTLRGWQVANPALTSLVFEPAPGDGSWALKLDADWLPPSGFVRAAVGGVQNGETLRLSARMRAVGMPGGGMMYLTSGTWSSERAWSSDPEWNRVSLTTTASTSAGDSLWVVLSALGAEITVGGAGLFDDVVLERLPTPGR
jgi:hypothetical protein